MMIQMTLNIYTLENVAYHILHTRLPLFTHRTLTDWFDHRTHLYRYSSTYLHLLDPLAFYRLRFICFHSFSSVLWCHPQTPSRLVLPFWYWLTQVVLEKAVKRVFCF